VRKKPGKICETENNGVKTLCGGCPKKTGPNLEPLGERFEFPKNPFYLGTRHSRESPPVIKSLKQGYTPQAQRLPNLISIKPQLISQTRKG